MPRKEVKVIRRRLLTMLMPLCLMCSLASAQTTPLGTADTLPTWTASDAQLQMLGPRVSFYGYSVRPPMNSTQQTQQTDNVENTVWRGMPNDDGSCPSLLISIDPAPTNGNAKQRAAEQVLRIANTHIKQMHANLTESKPETGILNGIRFVRFYYKGLMQRAADNAPVLTHGFVYGAFDGNNRNWILMEGVDKDPYYAQTSKELEAAALTLKPN